MSVPFVDDSTLPGLDEQPLVSLSFAMRALGDEGSQQNFKKKLSNRHNGGRSECPRGLPGRTGHNPTARWGVGLVDLEVWARQLGKLGAGESLHPEPRDLVAPGPPAAQLAESVAAARAETERWQAKAAQAIEQNETLMADLREAMATINAQRVEVENAHKREQLAYDRLRSLEADMAFSREQRLREVEAQRDGVAAAGRMMAQAMDEMLRAVQTPGAE